MNPLLAAVQGVAKSADNAMKSARTRMMEQVAPSPSMAYNLGMGIGPMLQAIVSEIKTQNAKKEKPTEKEKDKDKDTKAGLSESKKQTRILSTQLGSMVTLLRDIKSIGLVQLRDEQRKSFESRSKSMVSKITDQLAGKGTTDVTEKEGIGGTLGSIFTGITNLLPGLLKVALVGGGLYALWNGLFDDETRDSIKKFVFGENYDKDKSLTELITEKVWKAWTDAFEADPLLTVVGTGLAAWATGLLGILGVAGRVAWAGGKLVYNIGAFVGSKMNPAIPAAGAAAETAAATSMRPLPQTVKNLGLEAQKLPGLQGQPTAPSSPMPSAAPAAGVGTSIVSMMSKAMSVLSASLLGVGTVISGISSYQSAKEGKGITATLQGLSALLGTGALASMFIPGGQVATPFLAGGSALLGMTGLLTSMFEGSSKPATKQAEGPAPSGTVAAPRMDFKGGPALSQQEIMKLIEFKFGAAGYKSPQIWAAIANAARESGIGQNNHTPNSHEDSWGLFQMNRKGGLGQGYSPEQLLDPGFNTTLLLNALKQAESAKGYFGDNARGFRNATTKEEAAEYLRRFLFGNGTPEQQARGMQTQARVNQLVDAGKFGNMPSLVTPASSLAGAPSSYMPGPSQISASNVGSSDANSGDMLSQITGLVNDLTKQMMGGGITMVDNSDNSTKVSSAGGGGGGSGPAYVHDTIRSEVSGIVYPAMASFS